MSSRSLTSEDPTERYPLIAACCVLFVVLLRCAWVTDDAFITFRTVDNLWHGYGLTWNVDERVQAYTHPLWMFLLAGTYAVTRELYFTSIALSVALTLGATWLLATRLTAGPLGALAGVTCFACSKAFIDFSTSGLENPLTHFLLLLFLWIALQKPDDRRTFLWLTFLGALMAVTRMDLALIVFPELVIRFIRHFGRKTIGLAALGLSPFLLWELFALFYYGSPVPNTAFAKLNHDYAVSAILRRGIEYLFLTLTEDPLTIVVIAAAWVIPIATKQRRLIPIAIGSALYVLYVVWIGGDFMLGRFLTAPFVIGVVLLARLPWTRRSATPVLLLALIAGMAMPRTSLLSDENYTLSFYETANPGIFDERAHYYHGTGLLRVAQSKGRVEHVHAATGRAARNNGERLVITHAIGMCGYYAGPKVHLIDLATLADPLMARLKPLKHDDLWIAHHWRGIPAGYQDCVLTGQNRIQSPALADYYDHLLLIIRGDLWSWERLRAIVDLNLGRYDHLIQMDDITYEEPRVQVYP